jgi:hypothetical protein
MRQASIIGTLTMSKENLAWRDGIKARIEHAPKANPYTGDVALEAQWNAGWEFAAIILDKSYGEVVQ